MLSLFPVPGEESTPGVFKRLALLVAESGPQPCSYVKLRHMLLSTVLSSRKAIRGSCWFSTVITMAMGSEGGDSGQEDQLVISAVQARDARDLKNNRSREL